MTGAYRFTIYPDLDTVMEVAATLYPRAPIEKLGLAPLTSMFFTGENDRRFFDDFRSELHDLDGLMIHSGSGEWIWRPLRNPEAASRLLIRRTQHPWFRADAARPDLRALSGSRSQLRAAPSYWIEPQGDWGEGVVELIEMPTTDETNDNIVALWAPKTPLEPGKEFSFGYKLISMLDSGDLHPGGRVVNTYQAKPKALGFGRAGHRGLASLHHRLRRRRSRLPPEAAREGRDRAFDHPWPDRPRLHRAAQPQDRGLPRLRRCRGRARPDRGDARLPSAAAARR